MEVRLFPNSTRPGVGQRPRQESQRPMLPQHARQCPVLEAGSSLGYLVYPPLADNEAYQVEFLGEGQYQFSFYMGSMGEKWEPLFTITYALPIGTVGPMKENVEFLQDTPFSSDGARKMARIFIVPEDLGTPAGAVTLRGATNFQTPEGWDTVYTPIFNNIERPVAPMLIVRVETDWYAHESEFRYVLQPGEGIHGAHNLPIGQAFFVPRERVTLRDCTEEELAAIRQSKKQFARDKAAVTLDHSVRLSVQPALRPRKPHAPAAGLKGAGRRMLYFLSSLPRVGAPVSRGGAVR